MEKKNKLSKILPVFLAYIVMGFVDIVGVATGYIKSDFNLSDSMAQLIPSMALLWFFLFSVPAGILQDRLGKKKMLNIGIGITMLGMIIPFTHYSYPVMLASFIFLGIGNTIVQVSSNPLLRDVVSKERFSSYMSLSQFIKAMCSLLGPIITAAMASFTGNWKLVFAVYALTSLISMVWLMFTKIEESKSSEKLATFKSCFGLLKNKYILIMVLGIFFVVGSDVGMNSNIANYLQNIFNLSLENASLGISIYFTALMIGRFLGAVVLNWISPGKFLVGTAFLAVISLVLMLFAPTLLIGRVAIFLVGLGSANLFPLIFALSIEKMPDRANEISGLMIMAVSGGAFIPPIMGVVSSNAGVIASFTVLLVILIYVFGAGIYAYKKQ